MSFYTEVIVHDPRFRQRSVCRDPALLFPPFRELIRQIIAEAGAQKQIFQITETYRSTERQRYLWAEGATQLRDNSVHHYGLACDFVRIIGGKAIWTNPAHTYAMLGKLAAERRLVWGGDWPSVRDYTHIQYIQVADQDKLFSNLWYPT